MVRRALLLALALVVVCAAPAPAAVTLKKSMWGPAFKDGVSQFPIYEDLGVGIWQYTLYWHEIAKQRPGVPRDPGDTAYAWPAELDAAISEASAHGIQVSLLLIGAPRWANGNRDWNWAPDKPADWADFVEAAARRYPAVRHWMIWGEPTKANNFRPLQPDEGRPLRGAKLTGPRRYAQMLDASYVRLKALSRRNLVIGGNTFTLGTVTPYRFLPALRLPNGRVPRMDLFGHNPFTNRSPDLKKPPLGGGYADFSDLDTLARWIDRYLPRANPRSRKLKIFISEMTLPTDHANHEFNFYLRRDTQAEWLTKMLRITRSWSRIYTFGYLGLYDDPVMPEGNQVERGLIERDGDHKPAYEAFKRG